MPDNSKYSKTIGPRSARLITALYNKGRLVFCLKDVREITGLNAASTRSHIRKLVDRGVATRLKPGLYILVPLEQGDNLPYIGNPFIIARELMKGEQYYLSHVSAMEIHGMLTQPRLIITVSTPKLRRPLSILGIRFQFIQCRRRHLFGLKEHWANNQEKVWVSDLERTVIDGLKLPRHCGGVSEVARGLWIRRKDMNVDRLIQYAVRLGVGAVLRRLGFLLELYNLAEIGILEGLKRGLTATYSRLDPVLPAEGKYLDRWRLQLNIDPEELRAVARS